MQTPLLTEMDMTRRDLTRVDWLEIGDEPLFQTFLETRAVGAGYVPGIRGHVASLPLGGPLCLQREPWNPYDTFAIVVLNPQGQKLGYIPRSENKELARRLDCGARVRVVLTGIEAVHTGWPQIYIRVYAA